MSVGRSGRAREISIATRGAEEPSLAPKFGERDARERLDSPMLSAGCPYIHDLALHAYDESGQKQNPVRAELRRKGPGAQRRRSPGPRIPSPSATASWDLEKDFVRYDTPKEDGGRAR